jgi:hypothetical protein
MGLGDIYLQQSLAYLTPYDLGTILYLPGAAFFAPPPASLLFRRLEIYNKSG